MTLSDCIDFVCEELPDDYEIRIVIQRGTLDVELYNHHGHKVGFPDNACKPNPRLMLLHRLNSARHADGLGSVEYPKEKKNK